MVTDYRAAIERELGLTLDLQARDTLLDALRLGPGSTAWRDAIALVDLREAMQAAKSSPSRERSTEAWGRIVAVLGDIAIVATLAGVAVVGLLYGWRALWRFL